MGGAKNWEIESVKGQSEHIVFDFQLKSDHINILLYYMKHTFSSLYVCINNSLNTNPFNLYTHFANNKLGAYLDI